MLAIISVYNDRKVLGDWLLRGLESQKADYKLVLVDNTEGKFASAAAALNHGAAQIKGGCGHIMFAHQDVRFHSPGWLNEAESCLESLPDLGIAGVAGAREGPGGGGLEILSNVEHGDPPRSAGDRLRPGRPEKVQTLDECLFFIPADVFSRLRFDADTCKGWHLYAVDYCLSVGELGLGSYVLPLSLRHQSTGLVDGARGRLAPFFGPLPESYYRTLAGLLKKHERSRPTVFTTCGSWKTSRPIRYQRAAQAAQGLKRLLWG